MKVGVWVKQNGDREVREFESDNLSQFVAGLEGFDHFHLEGDPVGFMTVWGCESDAEGGVLNLFVTALVSSVTGKVRPFVGEAFITGPGDDGLSAEQVNLLVGAGIGGTDD